MKKLHVGLLIGAALVVGLSAIGGSAIAAKKKGWGKYQVDDRRSGYTYTAKETIAIQDDELGNPASLWLDEGQALWSKKDGKAGKACATCHKDAATTMKGVATSYPKYSKKTGKMQNVEQRINQCRTENMQAKPFKYESKQMLSMTIYVKNQSHGMPMDVSVDGPAVPFFEAGKKFYFQRRGQLDMSCANCHVDNPGNMIRANKLSQGQGNGFPTYRLKWQKPGSLHRRFRGCNKQVRAKPYGYGSDEYTNLELYLGWRARGLPVETPSVRM
ncbi:MAG: sulfur oxidation c-type cytochrome SoxA [Rhodospirillales bacterium]|nr:sulfur oxidation c-type cytochrome SoxA [Rhodospirillales bacterium]